MKKYLISLAVWSICVNVNLAQASETASKILSDRVDVALKRRELRKQIEIITTELNALNELRMLSFEQFATILQEVSGTDIGKCRIEALKGVGFLQVKLKNPAGEERVVNFEEKNHRPWSDKTIEAIVNMGADGLSLIQIWPSLISTDGNEVSVFLHLRPSGQLHDLSFSIQRGGEYSYSSGGCKNVN